jgi:hypothetical protein
MKMAQLWLLRTMWSKYEAFEYIKGELAQVQARAKQLYDAKVAAGYTNVSVCWKGWSTKEEGCYQPQGFGPAIDNPVLITPGMPLNTCFAPKHWDAAKNKCVCPTGLEEFGDKCLPPCPPGFGRAADGRCLQRGVLTPSHNVPMMTPPPAIPHPLRAIYGAGVGQDIIGRPILARKVSAEELERLRLQRLHGVERTPSPKAEGEGAKQALGESPAPQKPYGWPDTLPWPPPNPLNECGTTGAVPPLCWPQGVPWPPIGFADQPPLGLPPGFDWNAFLALVKPPTWPANVPWPPVPAPPAVMPPVVTPPSQPAPVPASGGTSASSTPWPLIIGLGALGVGAFALFAGSKRGLVPSGAQENPRRR